MRKQITGYYWHFQQVYLHHQLRILFIIRSVVIRSGYEFSLLFHPIRNLISTAASASLSTLFITLYMLPFINSFLCQEIRTSEKCFGKFTAQFFYSKTVCTKYDTAVINNFSVYSSYFLTKGAKFPKDCLSGTSKNLLRRSSSHSESNVNIKNLKKNQFQFKHTCTRCKTHILVYIHYIQYVHSSVLTTCYRTQI